MPVYMAYCRANIGHVALGQSDLFETRAHASSTQQSMQHIKSTTIIHTGLVCACVCIATYICVNRIQYKCMCMYTFRTHACKFVFVYTYNIIIIYREQRVALQTAAISGSTTAVENALNDISWTSDAVASLQSSVVNGPVIDFCVPQNPRRENVSQEMCSLTLR